MLLFMLFSMMPITQDLEISNGTYHTEKDVDALNTALSTKTTAAGAQLH